MGTIKPLINILIRNSEGRQTKYHRALTSISNQTYKNVKIISCYDFSLASLGLHEAPFEFYIEPKKYLGEFYYNDYCNNLKGKVKEGWFFFLDSDDYLADDTVLEKLAEHLNDDYYAIVCQMSRDNGKVKPSDEVMNSGEIISGRIGMPCLVLNSKLAFVADIPAVENGDYLWINEVVSKVPTKFVKQVLVHSPGRSFGL